MKLRALYLTVRENLQLIIKILWQVSFQRAGIDIAIDEAINTYKVVDQNDGLIDTEFALGIYIGTT